MWRTDCFPIDWDDDDVEAMLVIIEDGSLMLLKCMDVLHDSMFWLYDETSHLH